MSKGYNMPKHNNHEFAEGRCVFHQAYEFACMAEKVNAFVTKKNSQGNTDYIQPFWVMTVAPLLKFFDEVHNI